MAVRYDSGAMGGFQFPISDPTRQAMWMEDFNGNIDFSLDTVTQVSAGTFATLAGHGGLALADAGATTHTHGANIQLGQGYLEPDEAGDYAVEFRVKLTDTVASTTSGLTDEVFIGLAATDTNLIDSSDSAIEVDTQYIGVTSTAGEAAAEHMTLVACGGSATSTGGTFKVDLDTDSGVGISDFVRVGIEVKNGEAQLWVNGEKIGSAVSTNLPSSATLIPTIVCQAGAGGGHSNRAYVIVDYMRWVCSRSSTNL